MNISFKRNSPMLSVWLPKQNAFPPGKNHFPEDRYDEKVQEFREKGILAWLR